jgi:hypothetical protein
VVSALAVAPPKPRRVTTSAATARMRFMVRSDPYDWTRITHSIADMAVCYLGGTRPLGFATVALNPLACSLSFGR